MKKLRFSFFLALAFHYLCHMVFYFSGTGNTHWVASSVADACGEKLVSIAGQPEGELRFVLDEGERIGFCFPVHGWQPPHILRQFIARLNIENANGHYCFAVCTCGDNIGETMRMLGNDLAKRGIALHSAFSLLMPDTYVCLPTMDIDAPEELARKLDDAKRRVCSIAEDIRARRQGLMEVEKGPVPKLLTYVVGAYFNKHMITDKPFKVDAAKCLRCGLCAKVCPVNNIAPDSGGLPQWAHGGLCTCCLACYHHCPARAVSYGRRTKGKGQYYYGKEYRSE